MKKVLIFCFAVLAVISFMTACGGSDSNNSGESSSGTSICSYGSYECHDNDSYFCGYGNGSNDLMWLRSEVCNNDNGGCDSRTGKCSSNSGGGNNGGSGDNGSSDNNGNSSGNNDAECASGKFKCIGSESYYCNSLGSWVYDARCENGCDSATGKCKSNSNDDTDSGDSSDSGNNDHGDSGSTSECTSGEYKCDGSYSYYCSNGYWISDENCSKGCDSSSGKCKCIPGQTRCRVDGGYFSWLDICLSNGVWHLNSRCEHYCDKSIGNCKLDEKPLEVDGKMWTEVIAYTFEVQAAIIYCSNLTYAGYSDWHLPTISELRTITKCPETCRVSDSCLSSSECQDETCLECGRSSEAPFSGWIVSASAVEDIPDAYWSITPSYSISWSSHSDFRCVRKAN